MCVDDIRRIIPGGWHEHEAASVVVVAREASQKDSGQRTEHENAPVEHTGILSHNHAVSGYMMVGWEPLTTVF